MLSGRDEELVVRDARAVRDALLGRGGPIDTGFVRHAYRPFDNRWLYWEAGHGLLGRPVPDYRPHVFEGNLWLSAAQYLRKGAEGTADVHHRTYGFAASD